MIGVAIRQVEQRDSGALASLMTQLGYPTDEPQMQRRLSDLAGDADCAGLVAELDGSVIGMIAVRVTRGFEYDGYSGEVAALVVDQRFRERGIGARLVAAAEQWLRQRGAPRVKINSSNHRTTTHRFYEQLGFAATGLRFTKWLD